MTAASIAIVLVILAGLLLEWAVRQFVQSEREYRKEQNK